MTGEPMVRAKWERVLRWLMFAAFATLLAIATVSLIENSQGRTERVDLKAKLALAAQAPPGTVVELATMTDFPWDFVHVFEPYTPLRQADEQLGIRWFEGDDLRGLSLMSESKQALVFVANGRVVANLMVGRELIPPGRGVPRAKARFVVENGCLRWLGPD
jgi:hypothetical protein